MLSRYRRQTKSRPKPQKQNGDENLMKKMQLYGMKGVAEYMPPWEAILTKDCGLYQDYYLVEWEASHNRPSSSSWEPDECLPAGLDSERIRAKQEWLSRKTLK